ncbi:hypothetical protein NFI96_001492, partial [Prochilodus magdalenae]
MGKLMARVAFTVPSVDPCSNYNVLKDTWRSTNYTYNMYECDMYINWNGWYRLFYEEKSVQMPDSCVSERSCGTNAPLWLNGPHPELEDGVVIRETSPPNVQAPPPELHVLTPPLKLQTLLLVLSAPPPELHVLNPPPKLQNPPPKLQAPPPELHVLNPPPKLQAPPPELHVWVFLDNCIQLNCTKDERCGERDGVYGCFCNGDRTRMSDRSYDSRETCESSSGTMSLSRCQLFEAGFPTNVLHLSDPSCRGTLQNGRLVFHFDNDEHICGTNLTANGTHFIYENSIQGVADSAGGPISRKKELEVRFSCVYNLRQTLTMDTEFSPLQSIVHKSLPDGQGLYQVRMIPYQDAAFTHPYDGTEDIVVDQQIFMAVTVQGVDGRQIATVIDSCWVTPVNDQNFAVRWDLIINRCPNPDDPTVKVLQNGITTTGHFLFKMLVFNGNYSKVFLHCTVHLCLLQNNNCAAVHVNQRPPLVTSAYALNSSPPDPCNNYISLDQPWRANNETGLNICDSDFSWDGWYRFFYSGMNIRMSESCVPSYRCGTYYSMWLKGPHPKIEDGVVTRQVCGNAGSDCCYYGSTSVRVKACPGNYYVYELVRPVQFYYYYYYNYYYSYSYSLCNAAYCTVTTQSDSSFDPCDNYTVLDHYWRSTKSFYRGHDDTVGEWTGWYRLYLQGESAQLPDWCVGYVSCGGYTPLWLAGLHPRLKDGIVNREIYGAYGSQCRYYKSNPVQVKACSGQYYVYKLAQPAVSIPMPSYCTAVISTSYDPCNNYTSLDQPWRGNNETGLNICDSYLSWNGWYRFFYYGMDIRMAESCVPTSRCGTYYTLWLNGPHPEIEDGVVTRQVCGNAESDCCYFSSTSVQVKACPGNYYVYELVSPFQFYYGYYYSYYYYSYFFCNAAYCT